MRVTTTDGKVYYTPNNCIANCGRTSGCDKCMPRVLTQDSIQMNDTEKLKNKLNNK